MNILSDEQYRLLAFVSACNGSSYNPTSAEVMLWRNNPEPKKAEYRTVKVDPPLAGIGGIGLNTGAFAAIAALNEPGSAFQRMLDTTLSSQLRSLQDSIAGMAGRYLTEPTTRQELVKAAETVIAHLTRLTWLEEVTVSGKTGLRLTQLGRALLRNHEMDDVTHPDVSVVILESNDPLAYPLLVSQLAEAGEGLLVDPYLKVDGLHRIVQSTRLTRLLVTGKHNATEIAAMQTYLDSLSLPRHVEMRSSTELHDRILLTDDETVLTLGTSLNSIGRTTTVLTPMPPTAGDVLRAKYEEIWDNASLVGPQPDEDDEDDQDEDDETDDGDISDDDDENDVTEPETDDADEPADTDDETDEDDTDDDGGPE
ncbi:MAG: hypothetical protein JST91_26550 [Actinobacteria bacterium]|nr:hypothetical protein [Actinomycetota bacterium]